MVEFRRTFAIDPTFRDRLAAEAPGILRWAVTGARHWHEHGLGRPAAVTEATAAYQRDNDNLRQFIATRCIVGDGYTVRAGDLWVAYEAWAQAERVPDHERLGRRTFTERIRRQFRTVDGRRVLHLGVGLVADDQDERLVTGS